MKRFVWILSVALTVSLLAGCGPKRPACDGVALGSHSAVTPVPRGNDWWTQRHQNVLDQVRTRDPEVIFIGDSITHGWDTKGQAMWQHYYGHYDPINMGYSGDRTQHVLWRLQNGEVDGISPKVAVLMIGTNNSNGTDNTAEEIADGIQAIVCTLRQKLPDTKVLILAIFPRGHAEPGQGAAYNPQWAKNDEASRLASEMADGKMIHYLNINDVFLNDEGVLTRHTMPDLLHPEEEGYALWAEAMDPTLKRLLK